MSDPQPVVGVQLMDMDGVEDVMFVLDADRQFTFVNAFALKVWNRRADDLLGRVLEDGLPGRPSAETIEIFRRAVRTQLRCEFESAGFIGPGVGTDAAGVILYPHWGGLIVHCRRLLGDAAGLPQAAAPVPREVHPFVAFSRQLEELQDSNDVIRHTLEHLLTQTTFDYALYADCEGQQASITQQFARPGLPGPDALPDIQTLLDSLLPEVRRTRQTAEQTFPPSESGALPHVSDPRVCTALLTPVFRKGEVVAGLLLLCVHHTQAITAHTEGVAELTALHLEHALEFCLRADEDRAALDSRVLTLSVALEARDIETHRHTQRTAMMAVEFGERLGIQGTDLEHLRQSAYLHDLGKLCIPDTILQCAGRLTPEEWAVMQTHTTSGWALASRIPGLSPAVLEVIRHHHEHWDGSGYPDGLAGSEIPLLARIVAVCDVYDALISERPYKRAWDAQATLQEIQAQSGRLFDPEIVRAFLAYRHASS
ncbi:HD domain-containing phosphohydrolase [Deinococcus sp. UYEF24]